MLVGIITGIRLLGYLYGKTFALKIACDNQRGWGYKDRGGSKYRNRLWRAKTPSGDQSKYVREKWHRV
jgi:hypothetical protein